MRALHVLLCSHKLCGPETGRSLKRIRFIERLNLESNPDATITRKSGFIFTHFIQAKLHHQPSKINIDMNFCCCSSYQSSLEINVLHSPPIKMLITNNVSQIFFETFLHFVCGQPSTKSFSSLCGGTRYTSSYHPLIVLRSIYCSMNLSAANHWINETCR